MPICGAILIVVNITERDENESLANLKKKTEEEEEELEDAYLNEMYLPTIN